MANFLIQCVNNSILMDFSIEMSKNFEFRCVHFSWKGSRNVRQAKLKKFAPFQRVHQWFWWGKIKPNLKIRLEMKNDHDVSVCKKSTCQTVIGDHWDNSYHTRKYGHPNRSNVFYSKKDNKSNEKHPKDRKTSNWIVAANIICNRKVCIENRQMTV